MISGVESRNSERAFNYALVFADQMFFQGFYTFYLKRGIGSSRSHNKISDLVTKTNNIRREIKWIRCFYSQRLIFYILLIIKIRFSDNFNFLKIITSLLKKF